MITFKRLDWILQIFLLVGVPLFFWVNKDRYRDFDFLVGYFIVGGWQLISIVIHFFYPKKYKIKLRTLHGVLTLIAALVTAILVALNDDEMIIMFLIGILFVTPALAILYLITCFLETKALLAVEKPQS